MSYLLSIKYVTVENDSSELMLKRLTIIVHKNLLGGYSNFLGIARLRVGGG
jgi:hypothetical protein